MRSSKGEHGPVLIDFLLHINADLSGRVMRTLRTMAPRIEVYSIDEGFLDLQGVHGDLEALGRLMRARVLREVGIPVGVGIAPTKTLAKLANWGAKKWPATGGVVDLRDPARQRRLLALAEVGEVWGIGRKISARLNTMGVSTALQLIRTAGAIPNLDPVLGFFIERIEALAQSQLEVRIEPPPVPHFRDDERLTRLLTLREAEIAELLLKSLPNKKIALTLGVSLDTVKWHLKNIYMKLDAHGRGAVAERMRYELERGGSGK